MIIETKHLRMVLAVASQGSLTRAGRDLFLSQPALSQQLLLLEKRLGTPLFHRLGKRMVPTAAGARFVDTARRAVAELEALEANLRRLANGQEVVLRISTQCYTVFHWLPALIASYSQSHPTVDVEIVGDATFSPERGVLEGKVDVGILNRPGTDPRLRYLPLFEDEMVVVMPPEHPLGRRPFVSAEELAREHLFTYAVPPGHGIVMDRVFRPAGLRPRRVTEVQWTEAITEFVKAGMGVAVIAQWAVASQVRSRQLRARRLTEGGFHRRWFAAVPGTGELPSHVRGFVSALAKGPGRLARVSQACNRKRVRASPLGDA